MRASRSASPSWAPPHPHIVPRVQVLAALPDVRLIGCYDPDAQLAGRVAQRCGLRALSSAAELLDQPGVDLAIVEGWDTDNPRYVREAVGRSKAILLEKPGAPDLAEMRALIADLRDQPIPFQVGYMLAFSPAIAHAQRILGDGVLGPISLARFHAPGPVGAAREPCLSLPGDLGGVVYGDGAHVVDLMIQLLGVPRSVKATLLRLPEGQPVLAQDFIKDALVQETTEMPYGAVVHEDAGAAVFDYGDKLAIFDMTAWGAHPWVEAWSIEVYGTDGTLQVGLQPPWYRFYVRRAKSGYQPGWHSWRGEGVSGYANSLVADSDYRSELDHMLARVRAWDTRNEPWLAQAETVIAVLDAIYRSDRAGDAIAIEACSGPPESPDRR
jgi:predicted dehydrogenase